VRPRRSGDARQRLSTSTQSHDRHRREPGLRRHRPWTSRIPPTRSRTMPGPGYG
jgi:hypothetical protein